MFEHGLARDYLGGGPVILTSRGGVLLMVAVFTIGVLGTSWLGWTSLAGIAFLLGVGAAAWYTKPSDLLTVAVTPPLLFLCVLLAVKLITGGNSLVSVLADSLLTLASVAPWLFAGVALNVGIGLFRGLPRCLGELRGPAYARTNSHSGGPRRSRSHRTRTR